MVVNQLVFTHRALRKHKLSHFPIRYYIVIDVLSLIRQNWLLYFTISITIWSLHPEMLYLLESLQD